MPAVILLLLLTAQVTLGVLTVLLRKPADVASAHVAVGALVLVTSFVMMVRACGFMRSMPLFGRRESGSDSGLGSLPGALGLEGHEGPACLHAVPA